MYVELCIPFRALVDVILKRLGKIKLITGEYYKNP